MEGDKNKKRVFTKTVAIILIIYGGIGIIASVSGIFLVRTYFDVPELDGLTTSVQDEFESMSKTMQTASETTKDFADSIKQVQTNLHYTKNSLDQSAYILVDISPLMTELGGAFDNCFLVPVLEIELCPFNSNAAWFYDRSSQMENLATHLGKLSAQVSSLQLLLNANVKNVEELSENFNEMSEKLDEVSYKFQGFTSSTVSFMVLFLFYLLIWLSFLHVLLLALGICLYRITRY